MKAFVIIATGHPNYGEMALNLCLSIKANSNTHVCLIYTSSAVSTIVGNGIKHFDTLLPCNYITSEYNNPSTQAFYLKLKSYDYLKGIASEVIILDADTIIIPGKNLDSWFRHEIDFVAYINDSFDYKTNSYKTKEYHFWCEPPEMNKYFPISEDAIMPQINASFIYFRYFSFASPCLRNDFAKYIFAKALLIWYDNSFPYKKYRGSKTEEVCLNIACAIEGYKPPQIPYRPLYMECYSESIDVTYIQHRFNAFSMAGSRYDHNITSLYNRLSDYYREYFGLRNQFHYKKNSKSPTIKTYKGKIVGFWHVCMMNHWENVVREQLALMQESGLLDKAEKIFIGAVGSYTDMLKLRFILRNYSKIKIKHETDLKRFEFPTLEILKHKSDFTGPFLGFYIHTKGVSYKSDLGRAWRTHMNTYIITKWRDCWDMVAHNFDLCGVKLLQKTNSYPLHYSGNFFWFDSQYISTLPKIEALNHKDRFSAEMWACSNYPVAATLSQENVDHDKPDMPLFNFYHIYADGKWKAPVEEYIESLQESDLGAILAGFLVGIVGTPDNREAAKDYLSKTGIRHHIVAEADTGWEQVTQFAMVELAKNLDGYVLYSHTKGSSQPTMLNIRWRKSMVKHLVNNWQTATRELETHTAVGCHWLKQENGSYFAGTFFWTTFNHIRKLGKPMNGTRYDAEVWIGKDYDKNPFPVYDFTPFSPVEFSNSKK